MGRESRVRRSRPLKSSDDFVVFATAIEAWKEAKLVAIADRLGLTLPMISTPRRSKDLPGVVEIIKLTDND